VRARLVAATAVALLAFGFACLPFHAHIAGYKGGVGTGTGTISCRAPIFIGWSGGHPHNLPTGTTADRGGTTVVKGATEYDSSQQCGYDARQRLVISGIVACLALAALAVTIWRGLHKRYPLPSYW
jgi:hypothetical protein